MIVTHDVTLCRFVLWLMLALFTLSILISVAQNPLDADQTQIDEQAHLSYAQTLIQQERWWPDFNHFPMVENVSGKTLTDTNYLNHPPTFYWLAKIAHDAVPSLSTASYRYGALGITLITVILYGLIGQRLNLALVPTAVYAMMPWLIYVHKQVGFYNNDCIAILGGTIIACASLHWFNHQHLIRAFWLTVLGLAFASVKLTALLLVGFYAALCLIMNRTMLRSIPRNHWVMGVFILTICALPLVQLMLQTGSPAPNTIGQHILMTQHPEGENWTRKLIIGWVQEPHMDFLRWFASFTHGFAVQVDKYDTTFLALLLIAVGFYRACVGPASPLTRLLRAGFIATVLTFGIHSFFAWGRYQHYAWQLDSGLRYYYPLLAIYAAACGNALTRVSRDKRN